MCSNEALSTPRSTARWRLIQLLIQAQRIGIFPPLLLLAFALPVPSESGIAGIPSLCQFHRFTDLPCPLCGITRAVVCCAHGLYQEAFNYHPLGPAVLIVLASMAAVQITGIFVLRRRILIPLRLTQLMLGLGALALTAIWGARLVGALPSPP